ncbi:MAG: cytochrome c [Candidatus Nitrohelix vancouverensis]|uniref:Cytochrome c n=1 Tax=Candidatus Nitrohelix vancouverensis TaxID=2705534 RepID=A0A7T0G2Y6_9BACT|nr:MAG: cytochrome c [Candidatus Nitrohelix vancouverensis]
MIVRPTATLLLSGIFLCVFAASSAMAKDVVLKEPPKSLDKHYPPHSKTADWTGIMHQMSGHFGGVFINMRENDWDNAIKHADELATTYEKASKMVPEWEDYFDLKAAKDFAAAVHTKDGKKIGEASGPLGKTCGKCHAENQVAVWTKYHWPSVEKIKIMDPVDEKEIAYGKYMKSLSNTFKGVTVNFGEGQYDRSAKALGDFKKRFLELRSTCSKCHTTQAVKQFFVGKPVEKALEAMSAELMEKTPNAGKFWSNVGVIGNEGCKKCHLTHRAFAIFQETWHDDEK